jgi:beta-lactam-binding protein with PASTA domain
MRAKRLTAVYLLLASSGPAVAFAQDNAPAKLQIVSTFDGKDAGTRLVFRGGNLDHGPFVQVARGRANTRFEAQRERNGWVVKATPGAVPDLFRRNTRTLVVDWGAAKKRQRFDISPVEIADYDVRLRDGIAHVRLGITGTLLPGFQVFCADREEGIDIHASRFAPVPRGPGALPAVGAVRRTSSGYNVALRLLPQEAVLLTVLNSDGSRSSIVRATINKEQTDRSPFRHSSQRPAPVAIAIRVPVVSFKSVKDAEAELSQAGLIPVFLDQTLREVAARNIENLVVRAQGLQPGTRVNRGQTVLLSVSLRAETRPTSYADTDWRPADRTTLGLVATAPPVASSTEPAASATGTADERPDAPEAPTVLEKASRGPIEVTDEFGFAATMLRCRGVLVQGPPLLTEQGPPHELCLEATPEKVDDLRLLRTAMRSMTRPDVLKALDGSLPATVRRTIVQFEDQFLEHAIRGTESARLPIEPLIRGVANDLNIGLETPDLREALDAFEAYTRNRNAPQAFDRNRNGLLADDACCWFLIWSIKRGKYSPSADKSFPTTQQLADWELHADRVEDAAAELDESAENQPARSEFTTNQGPAGLKAPDKADAETDREGPPSTDGPPTGSPVAGSTQAPPSTTETDDAGSAESSVVKMPDKRPSKSAASVGPATVSRSLTPTKVRVPAVNGKAFGAASRLLKAKGLAWLPQDRLLPTDRVARTTPKAKTWVATGSTVKLALERRVPEATKQTYEHAHERLVAKRFAVRLNVKSPQSADVVRNQSPPAGSYASLGSPVRLELLRSVPDFRGVPVSVAAARLRELELNTDDLGGAVAPPLLVLGQEPEPGEAVPPGSKVILAPGVPVPALTRLSVVRADELLRQSALTTASQPGHPSDVVLAQRPEAHTAERPSIVPPGAAIDLAFAAVIPALQGRPLLDALQELNDRNLVGQAEQASSNPEARIASQQPAPNTLVDRQQAVVAYTVAVPVPPLTGKPLFEAARLLREADLSMAPDPSASSQDIVLEQAPERGSYVPIGFPVRLEPGVAVPLLVGGTPDDADRILRPTGLRGQIIARNREITQQSAADGSISVVGQRPNAGMIVRRSTVIQVAVVERVYAIPTPNVVGKARSEAHAILNQVGIRFAEQPPIVGRNQPRDPPTGPALVLAQVVPSGPVASEPIVVAQSPTAGMLIEPLRQQMVITLQTGGGAGLGGMGGGMF